MLFRRLASSFSCRRQVLTSGFAPAFSKRVYANLLARPITYRTMEEASKAIPHLLTKILSPELITLHSALKKHGFEVRLVGGVVRDMLLGKEASDDIDLAVDANGEEMERVFTAEGIRFIPTGIEHGTYTAVINKITYEITSLRIDTETDGRHAQVQFTKDWKLDAERRDLTINAMSLGFDGTLYDYFNGLQDLAERRVLFVGNADTRIKEDYLRILRYFRFHGRICEDSKHDVNTLQSIQLNAPGLLKISGERIWQEMRKLLAGKNVPHLVRTMYDYDVAKNIRLPEDVSLVAELERVCSLTADPVTRLASLLPTSETVDGIATSWRLANVEKNAALYIVKHRHKPSRTLKDFQDLLVDGDKLPQVIELAKYEGFISYVEPLSTWPIPVFPVNGAVMKQSGIKPGPHMGKLLKDMKEDWKKSDFKLTKEELIERHAVRH
eukprot:Colp12_sorted_trinity150504_noHs@5384